MNIAPDSSPLISSPVLLLPRMPDLAQYPGPCSDAMRFLAASVFLDSGHSPRAF